MTVVVGFYCRDGVVVGADSMLTPNMGNIGVGHHKGHKVHLLAGSQLFAFAGDQGQAARFQIMADGNHAMAAAGAHAIEFPLVLTQKIVQQFHNTGIGQQINVNTVLGFEHNGQHQLCVFEGLIQPRLLDPPHYYVALGSGKLSADPFLRFLVDIFCLNGPPSVREATFLTTWAIQHVIETNPGGVAGPIRVGVMERDPGGAWQSRLLSDNEVDDQGQAVESARQSLRDWRDSLTPPNNGNDGGEGVPPPPTLGGGPAAT
jgi:20S proteasome alpha/beta subunit